METPLEELERLTAELQGVTERLRAEERGEAMYTKDDVERIIEKRIARELRKVTRAQERIDELEKQVEELRREMHTDTTSL